MIDIKIGETNRQALDISIIRIIEIGPDRRISGELLAELVFDAYARIEHGLHGILYLEQYCAILWRDRGRIVENELIVFGLYHHIGGYGPKPFRGEVQRGLVRKFVFDPCRNREGGSMIDGQPSLPVRCKYVDRGIRGRVSNKRCSTSGLRHPFRRSPVQCDARGGDGRRRILAFPIRLRCQISTRISRPSSRYRHRGPSSLCVD